MPLGRRPSHGWIFLGASVALDPGLCYSGRMSTALNVPDLMTLEEFLIWDAPGPGRWQLIDGVPLAMAPAGSAHGVIQSNIANLIVNHLDQSGGPCVMMTAYHPGVSNQPEFFHPRCRRDLLGNGHQVQHPRPGFGDRDFITFEPRRGPWRNIRAYMLIPSVREILVIHIDFVSVDLLRRDADGAWPDDVTTVTEGMLTLTSLDLTLSLGALYRRSGIG